ncbi:MAG: YggS family pyridoxal phosphate-dependent enzyme [Parachlamydiaceae bacterium]
MNIDHTYTLFLQKVHTLAKEKGRNPNEISVVAVSKTHPLEKILPVYEDGCRDFGENRIPEVLEKKAEAPSDIRWHFIGTLQKNKINKAVGQFALIHSVDSFDLAKKIAEVSERQNVITPILLQVNTSGEVTKHGLSPEDWDACFDKLQGLAHLELQGLMTMAPFTEDKTVIHKTFSKLRVFKETLLPRIDNKNQFIHLSMGMSHDYAIAIEEGATLLRIGSILFGNR